MSKGVFADSDTHVFWDVDDWPTPNFENPSLIFSNINLYLRKEGYIGSLSGWAYGDAVKSMSKELEKEYRYAGFRFRFLREQVDEFEKVERMVEDIILRSWEIEEGEVANFVVLADISEEQMVYVLEIMKSKGHNVVFARKSQEDDDSSSSLIGRLSESGISEWICPNLLDEILVDESLEELNRLRTEELCRH